MALFGTAPKLKSALSSASSGVQREANSDPNRVLAPGFGDGSSTSGWGAAGQAYNLRSIMKPNRPGGGTGPGWLGPSGDKINNWVQRGSTNNGPGAASGGGAPDPGKGSAYPGGPAAGGAPATPGDPYGSQSGPGILESWFNQRANGTDPAYEYAMGRGMDSIDNRMSAGGSFNSGARGQQLSDFGANMGAQRMGQLDSLAGGASGEHQGRINAMMSQGMGLAGGQSGLNTAYDLAGLDSMNKANEAIIGMGLGRAGVDSKANQGMINNILGAYSIAKS